MKILEQQPEKQPGKKPPGVHPRSLRLVAASVALLAVAALTSQRVLAAGPSLPEETGEAAFAALAEMVARLDADPATDWEKVSIRALRDHLVDMHRLVTETVVEERPVPGGFTARVTGSGPTRDAIHRMLPAHGRMLTALGYEVEVETSPDGAVLTVREGGPEPAPGRVARLRGLGFYGVMTLGDHHRSHHLAMATGQPMHGHDMGGHDTTEHHDEHEGTGHGGGTHHPSDPKIP